MSAERNTIVAVKVSTFVSVEKNEKAAAKTVIDVCPKKTLFFISVLHHRIPKMSGDTTIYLKMKCWEISLLRSLDGMYLSSYLFLKGL